MPPPSETPGVHLALYVDETRMYTTDQKDSYILRKLQRGFTRMESCCERWNDRINEGKSQTIYFSHRRRPVRIALH